MHQDALRSSLCPLLENIVAGAYKKLHHVVLLVQLDAERGEKISCMCFNRLLLVAARSFSSDQILLEASDKSRSAGVRYDGLAILKLMERCTNKGGHT